MLQEWPYGRWIDCFPQPMSHHYIHHSKTGLQCVLTKNGYAGPKNNFVKLSIKFQFWHIKSSFKPVNLLLLLEALYWRVGDLTWWNSRSLQTIFGNFFLIKISHRKIQNFLYAVSSVSFCAQHIKFYVIAYLRSLSKNCHAYFWNGRSYYWTSKKILYWYSKILEFNSISLESLIYIFYGWSKK